MNLKVRLKNPVFWIQLLTTIVATVLAYAGLTAAELTTWDKLWGLIGSVFSNPYCLFLIAMSIWNILNDPTTSGVTDSKQALTYTEPKSDAISTEG